MIVDGREVVQIPIEDYNVIMEFIAAEKKKKDDFYRQRIEMAERYLEEGGPFISLDELFDHCKEYARARRMKDVVND